MLIIANAIGGEWDAGAYARPGFTEAEADAVRDWVTRGGSLFLVADHAPMGVAAENLARRFSVTMSKGFTEDSTAYFNTGGFSRSILLFSRSNGLLKDHPITRGRGSRASGSTASSPSPASRSARLPGAQVVLALSDHAFDHPPPTSEQAAAAGNPGSAWRTAVQGLPTTSAKGRVLGLTMSVGKGRVIVLAEAAMLSAQAILNPAGARVGIMGMNVPGIGNKQFALNALHWLTRVLP